ncbi:MAG: sulfite oxidase-like oxidoreductase [Anaerolineae bacterium]|nr:sulfite oxidase-like oxidoreductase [Anaerolineae bacterium]
MKTDKPPIPPGQVVTSKFPVLHVGPIPTFDPQRWDFRIFGLVEEEVVFSYQEFMSLPKVEIVSDFHCVTRWSRLNNLWEGVTFREVMKHIRPRPEARYVMVHSDGDYSTNLPLLALLDDDVLFAYRHDGRDLTPEYGWPLRLVVPKRYAWKSAKWVRGLEFREEDRPGYWEAHGYHNDGDPWKEERYAE